MWKPVGKCWGKEVRAGKVVREVQTFHALVKVVPESNPVARKEVREEH